MKRPKHFDSLRLIVILVAFSSAATVTFGCNIPVFRYALERWEPDPYEVIIFHRGALSDQDQKRTRELQEQSLSGTGAANATLSLVDLQQTEPVNQQLFASLATEHDVPMPYVALRAAITKGQPVTVWHGSLASIQNAGLLQSPARDKLVEYLLSGDAIVWLVIQSTDSARNDSIRQRLEIQSKRLARSVQLPEGVGLPGSELYSDIPLVNRYRVLEISRADPGESVLIEMLSRLSRQAFAENQPLVIPVFGRGRALEVIPASDLSSALLEDITVFLSGACSCQVKERNPGFDLLIAVDWNDRLFDDPTKIPPPETTLSNPAPIYLTIPPGNRGKK